MFFWQLISGVGLYYRLNSKGVVWVGHSRWIMCPGPAGCTCPGAFQPVTALHSNIYYVLGLSYLPASLLSAYLSSCIILGVRERSNIGRLKTRDVFASTNARKHAEIQAK